MYNNNGAGRTNGGYSRNNPRNNSNNGGQYRSNRSRTDNVSYRGKAGQSDNDSDGLSDRQPYSVNERPSYNRRPDDDNQSGERKFYNNRSNNQGGDRPSYNRRPEGNSFGERRFQGGRPNFRRNSGGNGGKKGRFNVENIDVSLFVNKAVFKEEEKYVPQHKFADFNIEQSLKNNIIEKGYEFPTPIQDQAIEPILSGADVIGIANTGTGKTAAFLIPLINKVLQNRYQKVLIVVPTRELAMQIKDEYNSFVRNIDVNSVLCIGGADMRRQIENLKKRHNFVIGTPGRLKDLIMRKVLNISQFNNIVLDEVDRMLDMGFMEDVKFLIEHLSPERQSLFFSATMKPKLEVIAKSFLKDPISISVKTRATSSHVNQEVIRVNRQNKINILHDLLIKEEFTKVLIFGRTKHGVDKIYEELIKRGHRVDSIHGDKSQMKRQKAITAFKRDLVNILIATDVAARGLDIPNVSHVINFDIPGTFDDYAHRIGRTGRGSNVGSAITFVD
ncbi:MAG: DEAD/DEAH box helicase [bacterium]